MCLVLKKKLNRALFSFGGITNESATLRFRWGQRSLSLSLSGPLTEIQVKLSNESFSLIESALFRCA